MGMENERILESEMDRYNAIDIYAWSDITLKQIQEIADKNDVDMVMDGDLKVVFVVKRR